MSAIYSFISLENFRRNILAKVNTVKSSECVYVCREEIMKHPISGNLFVCYFYNISFLSEFSPPQVVTPRTSGSPKPASEGSSSSSTDCVTIQVTDTWSTVQSMFPQYWEIMKVVSYLQPMNCMLMMVLKV